VQINELLPNPASGQAEWLELYNPSDQTVSISGWHIQRTSSSGVVRQHTLEDATLPPFGFALFSFSGGFLPNSGASLALFDAQGRVVDEVDNYPELSREQGYARTSDGADTWTADYPLSPGAPNLPATDTSEGVQEVEQSADDSHASAASAEEQEETGRADQANSSTTQPAARLTHLVAPEATAATATPFVQDSSGIQVALPVSTPPGISTPGHNPQTSLPPATPRGGTGAAASQYQGSGGSLYEYRMPSSPTPPLPAQQSINKPAKIPSPHAESVDTPAHENVYLPLLLAASVLLIAAAAGCLLIGRRQT
jgi:hypothetical protein